MRRWDWIFGPVWEVRIGLNLFPLKTVHSKPVPNQLNDVTYSPSTKGFRALNCECKMLHKIEPEFSSAPVLLLWQVVTLKGLAHLSYSPARTYVLQIKQSEWDRGQFCFAPKSNLSSTVKCDLNSKNGWYKIRHTSVCYLGPTLMPRRLALVW